MMLDQVQWVRSAGHILSLCAVALVAAPLGACSPEDGANPLPGNSSGTTAPDPEPQACEPGETRPCTIPIGTEGGILSCIEGVETCSVDAAWDECAGEVQAHSAPRHMADGLTREQLTDPDWVAAWRAKIDLERLGHGAAGVPRNHVADVPESCDSPCDPDCQEFPDPITGSEEVPGEPVPPDPFTLTLAELLALAQNLPNGHLNKLMFGAGTCTVNECHADSYCGNAALIQAGCSAWLGDQYNSSLTRPDLTLGFGCGARGTADGILPLCNRGGVAYVGNVYVEMHNGNSGQIGSCNYPAAEDASCTFAANLDPGECMRLPTNCAPSGGNNKAFIVDPLNVIDEGAAGPGNHDCNNWGYWRNGAVCGGTCGTNSGIWECDDPDENGGGCEDDCEVRFHGDEYLEVQFWEEYVAFAEFRPTTGAPWQDLQWVWDADGCTGSGNEYYLEYVVETPDHYHMQLCPSFCATINDTAEFQVDLACYEFDDSLSGSQAYEGSCPELGTKVTWQYAGWNGVTPGDSDIVFEVRSATTHDGLATATWKPLATASATGNDDDQTPPIVVPPACRFDDGGDGCPVSLSAALGSAATNEFLEIRYTLNSGNDGATTPLLYELQISYTCPDTE